MKKLLSTLPRWLRGTLLGVLIAAVLGGGIYGVLLLIRGSGDGVNVYPVSDLSVSYASAGNAETGGNVRADRVQSVYTSSTQQVTRIHVREGQTVSVGDPILTFDTTLTDLELERQSIAVRQLELDLANAKREQAKINTYRVFSGGSGGGGDTPEVTGPSALKLVRKGAGTKEDPAVIIWNDTCTYDEAFLQLLFSQYGDEVYAVFEVRSGDAVKGALQRCWEIVFHRVGGSWSFNVVAPAYEEGDSGESTDVQVDMGVSFSWADLVRMKQEAAQKIINVELDLKVAQLKYDTLEYELNNGVITSQIEGVVKSVLDPETALAEGKPVVLISGGGGYYVTGALSETELSSMKVGDKVSVLSWETYETMEGTILEISEYPADNENGYSYYYHYSNGNQNVSLYPFTVFLPEDAKLREGEYVQMSYAPGVEEGGGLCLQEAFIRSEGGKSYVWCQGADGKLEQRWIRTGRSLWGSYLEILGDLTAEDWVAFPYGKGVRAGVKTTQAGTNELYSRY